MIGCGDLKKRLGGISHLLQEWLFPKIEGDIGDLDEKDKLFVKVMAMFDSHSPLADEGWWGHRPTCPHPLHFVSIGKKADLRPDGLPSPREI